MSIQQLATQGRERTYSGLAAIDTARLRQMRDSAIRNCFLRFEETTSRIEHVATIHGKEYINDAAARSVNATLYTLHRTSGPIVWIAMADDSGTDYTALRSIALRTCRPSSTFPTSPLQSRWHRDAPYKAPK